MRKVIFLGTPKFAVPILDRIIKNELEIICVFTQPPKKSNRGQKFNKSPINLFSENISLKIRTPDVLKNNIEEEEYLNELNPERSEGSRDESTVLRASCFTAEIPRFARNDIGMTIKNIRGK